MLSRKFNISGKRSFNFVKISDTYRHERIMSDDTERCNITHQCQSDEEDNSDNIVMNSLSNSDDGIYDVHKLICITF